MKTRILSTLLTFCVLFPGLQSQDINKNKLDSLFSILSEKNKAMGSIAISRNGKLLYTKAIGFSATGAKGNTPANNLTKYRVGSITKMFTSTMIMQLVEENKISINSTLDKWYPGIPNAGKITVGNMLNHRSGIHSFTSDADYTTWMTQPKTRDEMIAIISGSKPDFQPDEKFEYSNSNYVLLGYIIEKVTGKSYSENLSKRILSKAGLTETYLGGKTNIAKNESYSFGFKKTWEQKPETDMSIPGGAGAIVSTPSDLVNFIQALFSEKLVSKASLEQMKTITDGYGLGMFRMPFHSHSGYGHNGGIDGFGSSLGYFPEDGLAVAYCSNGVVYSVNDIMIGVLSICYNMDYKIPTFVNISLGTGDLDKYLGTYSSTQLPLKITISKKDTKLVAQATGQPSFELEATETDTFTFDQAGIAMKFSPEKNEFVLKQSGGTFLFTKEK